jgi:hypothetical protein
MLTLLRRLLFGAPRAKTRLTWEEVKVLADTAAQAAHIKGTLTLISVRQLGGRLVWNASTPTAGSGWFVEIDDATGEVGPIRRWGVR